nr:uncharacterized protein LOC113843128 isoform X2 [Anas platyrhynchos]
MVIAETAGAAAVLNHGREMALLALPRRAQTRQDPWHLLGLESQPCTHSTGMAPAAWAARSWFTPLTRPTAGARIRPAAGVNRPMEIRWSPARQQQLKRWHQKLFFMHKTSYFCMTFGFTAAPARRAGCLSLAKARMEDFLFFLFFFFCRTLASKPRSGQISDSICQGAIFALRSQRGSTPCPPAPCLLKTTETNYIPGIPAAPQSLCRTAALPLSLFSLPPDSPRLWPRSSFWEGGERQGGGLGGQRLFELTDSLPSLRSCALISTSQMLLSSAIWGGANPRSGRERGGEGEDESSEKLHLLSCFSCSEKKHLSVISYNMGDVASCQFSEDANNPLTSYAKYRRVPALAAAFHVCSNPCCSFSSTGSAVSLPFP